MATRNTQDRRPPAAIIGAREAQALVATLGGQVRTARMRRRLTQRRVADAVGISRARLAEIERGEGGGAPVGTWIGLGVALGQPFAAGFSRPTIPEPRDAGHLAIQEFVLGLAGRHGWGRQFELPTRPARPSLSVDVLLRLDRERILLILEIWNRLEDLGEAVRTTNRKEAEAAALAVVAGGDGPPYAVRTCWILRDSAANRDLVRRYPSILRTAFPGSSRAWVAALEEGTSPPPGRGIIWANPATGLSALNLRSKPGG